MNRRNFLILSTLGSAGVVARSPGTETSKAEMSTDAENASEYFDAERSDVYVAMDGNDSNPGTKEKPFATLARARTGPARLRGRLPPDARVAHKTGTGATVQGVTIAMGDVGIVTAPGGDAFAIAVLIAGSRASEQAQEAVIARMARAAWDAFVRK